MTNDRNTPLDMGEFFYDLRELLDASAEASRHDQAIVGISFCIDHGIDTGPQIIGVMRQMGFNHRHIGAVLHSFSGASPIRYYWQRDEAGHYRNLPQA